MEHKILLNRRGQSTVEYIMLLAVIIGLALGLFRSPYFRDFFSEDGSFFEAVAVQMEHSYRHAFFIEKNTLDYNGPHDSFYNADQGGSRFFVGNNAYPQ